MIYADLKCIQLPPKMRKRGRPKGAEKTVVGLTRKKAKSSGSKPLPFLKKHPIDKEKGTHNVTLCTVIHSCMGVTILDMMHAYSGFIIDDLHQIIVQN